MLTDVKPELSNAKGVMERSSGCCRKLLENFQDLVALRVFADRFVHKMKMYDGRPILGSRKKTCP